MSLKSLKRLLTPLALLLLVGSALPQNYNPFNQRDDQYRLLGLKRAKEAYEVARADFERQQELYDKNLITALELERARSIFSDAEVNYQQSLLAVLFERQYVSVAKAVKYQADDGTKHVRLTLVNTSGGSEEFHKLINIDDELFRALQPDVIQNLYVSLMNDDNAIVSQPYEAKVSLLKYGEPRTLDFELLEDLDAVTIFIIYGNGSQRSMKVFLQKDASGNKVVVQSEQFSQELELGETASFDLTLELFSGTSNTFSLEVVNLPRQINRFFETPDGRARLSQLKFTESSRTKEAALTISLPDRPSEDVAMDTPIPFYVLVMPRSQAEAIGDLHTRTWTDAELRALEVGLVRLEVLPRGRGRLLVRSPQLYQSIQPGGVAEVTLELLNEGSHSLNDIEIKADLPLNWTKEINPDAIAKLAISEEARVALLFTPPEDIAPGKYEIRIRTSAMSNNQPVTGMDKTVTVEVRAETNVAGTAIIVLLVIGLVGGIVVFGIRLSRR